MTPKKLFALISVPIRLGGAGLLVFLAYQAPYLVLVLLVLTLLAGLAGLLISIVLRRAVRLRSRTKCAACDFRPLRIARICLQCHTPLLAATVCAMPPGEAAAVIEAAIALAWASGEATSEERGYLAALIKATELPEESRARLIERVEAGTDVAALSLPALDTDQAERVLAAAAKLVTVDGSLLPKEVEAYHELARKLGIANKNARNLLDLHRKLAWA